MPRGVQDRAGARELLPRGRARPLGGNERHRLPRALLPALLLPALLVPAVLPALAAGSGRRQLAARRLPVDEAEDAEPDRHHQIPVRQRRLPDGRGLPGERTVHVQAHDAVPPGASGLHLQPVAAVVERPAARGPAAQ
ncbi:hypothetical protein [Spirillospora sp. NPDC048824]|uniref:hypothetical protein n=1 Tax=Spirillospora sp. NPDC048824 TaxID=3364526 RepID=UPI0037138DB1